MKSEVIVPQGNSDAESDDQSALRSFFGTAALMVAHCAGMLDLVALPVWVGTLTSAYKLDPQRAGGLVSCFLLGIVLSSCFFAPRLNRIRHRIAIPAGYAAAALVFVGCAIATLYLALAGLHFVAGIAIGCSLSLTHGVIGHSRNPHKLFAIVGLALGVFAIAFLSAAPVAIAQQGGNTLFKVFAAIMAVAAVVTAVAFPAMKAKSQISQIEAPFSKAVWFGMIGVSCMALNQAMLFSFVLRIGLDRGFGITAVTSVLIALGLVNLFPSPLAAFLQRRVPARSVVLIGPLIQRTLALTICLSSTFKPYALATAVFPAVMIFTHTFAFGALAQIDRSGRAVAATPVMLMTGAAIGPILGGSVVRFLGYGSLGMIAALMAVIAVACFSRLAVASMRGQ